MKAALLLTCAVLACSLAAAGQDFLGGFAPDAPKPPAAAKTAAKTQQTAKTAAQKAPDKAQLPDLPNKLDEQGRKHGQWGPKYPNGRYRYKATFDHGRPVGLVKRYDQEGKMTISQDFRDGDSCYVKVYRDNGKVEAKGFYVSQKREGEWRLYNQDGYPLALYKFVHGKMHGIQEVLYEDGKTLEQTTYVDGVKEGPYYKYFAGGSKEIEGAYHQDQLHGPYRIWGNDGKLVNEGQYDNGTTVGTWHVRYPDAGDLKCNIVYDKHGLVINRAEVDSIDNLRNQYYERNIGKFKDPADYIDHPEDYVPFQ